MKHLLPLIVSCKLNRAKRVYVKQRKKALFSRISFGSDCMIISYVLSDTPCECPLCCFFADISLHTLHDCGQLKVLQAEGHDVFDMIKPTVR